MRAIGIYLKYLGLCGFGVILGLLIGALIVLAAEYTIDNIHPWLIAYAIVLPAVLATIYTVRDLRK